MIQRLLFLLTLLLGAIVSNALHFYLDANEKRCFIEELPTDTVVEGPVLEFRSITRQQTNSRSLPCP
jgi:hypothetical protein